VINSQRFAWGESEIRQLDKMEGIEYLGGRRGVEKCLGGGTSLDCDSEKGGQGRWVAN